MKSNLWAFIEDLISSNEIIGQSGCGVLCDFGVILDFYKF